MTPPLELKHSLSLSIKQAGGVRKVALTISHEVANAEAYAHSPDNNLIATCVAKSASLGIPDCFLHVMGGESGGEKNTEADRCAFISTRTSRPLLSAERCALI